jgi:hypothetical protein
VCKRLDQPGETARVNNLKRRFSSWEEFEGPFAGSRDERFTFGPRHTALLQHSRREIDDESEPAHAPLFLNELAECGCRHGDW